MTSAAFSLLRHASDHRERWLTRFYAIGKEAVRPRKQGELWGFRLNVDSPRGPALLDVLRRAGFDLPSSCELGVCGSCECGYRDGTVIHRDAVLPLTKRRSRMMACVSRARDAVTLDL